MTDVQSLRGTTVAEILSSGHENLDRIEAVAVSVLWKDGQVTNRTLTHCDAGGGSRHRITTRQQNLTRAVEMRPEPPPGAVGQARL